MVAEPIPGQKTPDSLGYQHLRADFEPFAEFVSAHIQPEIIERNPVLQIADLLSDPGKMEAFRKGGLFRDISAQIPVEGEEERNKYVNQKRKEDDLVFRFSPLGEHWPVQIWMYQDAQKHVYKWIMELILDNQDRLLEAPAKFRPLIKAKKDLFERLDEYAREILIIPQGSFLKRISERASQSALNHYVLVADSQKEGIDGKRYSYTASNAGEVTLYVEDVPTP